MAGACLVITFLLPPFWPAPDVYPKWRYLAGHKNEFDTFFVGSSLIRHHVIPQQFDSELAAGGMPGKSFNFGCSGMWPPESYYVARSILKLRPAKLRWVFIDAIDMNTRSTGQEMTTLRCIHWHDTRHTAFALDAVWDSKRNNDRMRLMLAHGCAFGMRSTNTNRGADWLSQLFPSPAIPAQHESWTEVSGFEPEPQEAIVGTELARFEAAVGAVKQHHPTRLIRPELAEAVLSLAKELRRAHAEPIFIMPPEPDCTQVQGWPESVPLLSFNDPDGYPQLFDPALRYDFGHFNPKGAEVFTSALAKKFLEWRQSHPDGAERGDPFSFR